jgi:hypothetical protein
VGHDLGRQAMIAGDKALQLRNEIVIGKAGQGSARPNERATAFPRA